MKIFTICAASLPLMITAGCTATTNAGNDGDAVSPPPMEMICKNDALPQFVGQKATQQTGAAIVAAAGARTLRWVGPGMAVTMDFRPDRVTVGYDQNMVIETLSCG